METATATGTATLRPSSNPPRARSRRQSPPSRRRPRRPRPATAGVKNFVLDTNVLLHDPFSFQRFEENHVWVPVEVLAELDKFKNEQSERGANARAVHRAFSRIFSGQDSKAVTQGVRTDGGGTIRLAVFDHAEKSSAALTRFRHIFPDTERVDHRILADVLLIEESAVDPDGAGDQGPEHAPQGARGRPAVRGLSQ